MWTNYNFNYPQEKHSTRVVLELIRHLLNILNKESIIYLDNFYTSIYLAEFSRQNNTDIGWGLKESECPVKLQKNEKTARFKNKLVILKMKDKKDVVMVSSIYNDEKTMVEKRGGRQEKLNVILNYNKEMGGIDMGNGLMVAYSIDSKNFSAIDRYLLLKRVYHLQKR